MLPSRASLAGKLLRAPFDLLPSDTWMRMVAGPGRGLYWQRGAGTIRASLGLYESSKVRMFSERVGEPDSVFDLGAHAGYFSLIAAKLGAHVVAVEPEPQNLLYLRRHIERNGLSQSISVVEAVASSDEGTVRIGGRGRYESKITLDGELTVDATTIDRLTEEFGAPTLLKIDIEGAEAGALEGAPKTLSAERPTIFLATHGHDQARLCRSILEEYDYHVQVLATDDELLATPR